MSWTTSSRDKPVAGSSPALRGSDHSVADLQAELNRQRTVFEAELRRQRDFFNERIEFMGEQLGCRETDCRNLQSVVTILGRKLDTLSATVERLERVEAHARRRSPARGYSPPRDSSAVGRTASGARLQSPNRPHVAFGRTDSSQSHVPEQHAAVGALRPPPLTTTPSQQVLAPHTFPEGGRDARRPPSPRPGLTTQVYRPAIPMGSAYLRGPTPTRVLPDRL